MAGDRVNELYHGEIMQTATQEICRERIHWMCSQATGRRTLDLGCSQGIASLLLAREGHEVVGVDIDPEAIAYAQRCIADLPEGSRRCVTFQLIDPGPLPFEDASFDTVLLGEILEHQTRPETLIAEAGRVLSPGGRLVITTPFGLHPHPEHVRTFYLSDFVHLLEGDYTLSELFVAHKYIHGTANKSDAPMTGADALTQTARLLTISEVAFRAAEQHYWERYGQTRDALTDLKAQRAEERNRDRQELQRLHKEFVTFAHHLDRWLSTTFAQDDAASVPSPAGELAHVRELLGRLRAHADSQSHGWPAGAFLQAVQRLHEAYVRQLESQYRNEMTERDSEIERIRQNARRLKARLDNQEEQSAFYRAECERKFEEVRYQLGDTLINVLSSPKDFVLLPFRLIQLWKIGATRRSERARFEALEQRQDARRTSSAPQEERPESPASSTPANSTGAIPDDILTEGIFHAADGVQLKPIIQPATEPRHPLRAAIILDTFTMECFHPEFHMTSIRPDDWQDVLRASPPDFLFVESAWKGNGLAWQHLISQARQREGEHLFPLVDWCKRRNIPTVFWNKEDPPNYEHFITAASRFDYIFTTDEDCVARYRADAGHDRVRPLPFAAQPLIHNPINTVVDRPGKICFAGTYYNRKHRGRVDDMEMLLRPAISRGLHIFDRMYHYNVDDAYRYPDVYQPAIQGGLPYDLMLDAYRNYQIFLNVNSVSRSPTMFSRRVFELLACGTPVISTWSDGIERILGPECVALVANETEAADWMDRLLNDADLRERRSMIGQRKVFGEHTYEKRFQEIARHVGLEITTPDQGVSVIGVAENVAEAERLLEHYERQTWSERELLLVLRGDVDGNALETRCNAVPHARVIPMSDSKPLGDCMAEAIRQARRSFIACLSPQSHYGDAYLTDLMHAYQYADAELIGKATHYAWQPETQHISLEDPRRERTFVSSLAWNGYVARKAVFDRLSPTEIDWRSGEGFFKNCAEQGIRMYAADRFNYVSCPFESARAESMVRSIPSSQLMIDV